MSRDYETLYYEQQASFTESNGMLTRENEELRKRISEVQSELADWETATGCKTHPDAALRFELLQTSTRCAKPPARLVQLLGLDMVAAQQHPEVICIGEVNGQPPSGSGS